MNNILIIGDCNSAWIINFIKNVVMDNFDEVIVYTPYKMIPNKFYEDNGIQVITAPLDDALPFKGKRIGLGIRFIYHILLSIKIRNNMKFDVINLQYVTWNKALQARIIKGNTSARIIWSYWGSDLFRKSYLAVKMTKRMLKKVDFVTFDSIGLKNRFEEIFPNCTTKNRVQMFGLPVFDVLGDAVSIVDKNKAKKELGIPTNCITIGVGYNAEPSQQHCEVLKAIYELPDNYKDKIVVLLQMTYAGTVEYISMVEQMVKKMNLNYCLYTDFMNELEVARFRLATDIYVNAQTTDAVSGSVCENFYCGNVVFNAAWLQYEELSLYGLQYIEFNSFNELSKKIRAYFDGKIVKDFSSNKERVELFRSYKVQKIGWKRLLIENE